ncbi:hypothetical protein K7X08_017155 [Anisodus acutangulus]|uniref:Uncharacterized protein n=1 Tax=Anisodus acutangulus TaxID=402998 RepID=A0A9Q1LU09_9SOLA|nr:hypothetical protein K7X08_017155 [Anisodus acutangulus]
MQAQARNFSGCFFWSSIEDLPRSITTTQWFRLVLFNQQEKVLLWPQQCNCEDVKNDSICHMRVIKSRATTVKQIIVRRDKRAGRGYGTTLSVGGIRPNVVARSFSSTPLANKNLAPLQELVERNFVDPNSSIGDKFGVGVTGSTPPSPSVGGILLVDRSSIHASNTYEDSTARVYALRLPMQIVVVGDEHGYCGSRKFGITWLFYGDRDPL